MSFSSSTAAPDFLNGGEPTMVDMPPPPAAAAGNDNIAAALSNSNKEEGSSSSDNNKNGVGSVDYSGAWSLMGGIMTNSLLKGTNNNDNKSKKVASPPSSGNNNTLFFSSLSTHTTAAVSTLTKSITNTVTGRNTLPDKTTASQVLMFRQLLHTSCRPGLRLSRGYEGTAAQKAVLHMPWWERGIERSGKMIISYDNLITRLWISGAILPFDDRDNDEEEDEVNNNNLTTEDEEEPPQRKGINTLVNERGLPPIPHTWWVDRLGFQQDDPVTDFRSGGVLSLAMLVHIVESCPDVHARFVPKKPLPSSLLQSSQSISEQQKELLTSLEEIIHDDASVLPFGITCINITDMLAKFLLFSKSIDKMDALLSAKPFWKMFLDPNAMLVLQEVSLDLLCDVCVEIGRERRLRNLLENDSLVKDKMNKNAVGMHDRCGKITVFDFTEIMERTEKRVGDEVLGAGPRNVEELRAVARRVKSKYLMRIQLKEKHLEKRSVNGEKQQQVNHLNESMKNVVGGVGTVVGGVGGFVNRFRGSNMGSSAVAAEASTSDDASASGSGIVPSTPTEEVNFDGGTNDTTTSSASNPFGLPSSPCGCLIDLPADDANDVFAAVGNSQEDDLLSSNPPPVAAAPAAAATITVEASATTTTIDNSDAVADLSGALSEAFDLLGDGDFTADDLDAMDVKVDAASAFTLDDL
mmetsp:Transcript_16633/g.25138  ORF Transcript_16633/g.25138 Transcript_16633/m.25138 type:complete len:693 (+) Transcript_16633:96-2174(+)